MRHLRWLALLVIAAALGACGGTTTIASGPAATDAPATGTTPTSTAPTAGAGVARAADGAVNACALLDPAAIQAAIGTSVVEAVPYGDPECRWRVEPLPAFPGATDAWVDVQFFANDLPMQHVEAEPDNSFHHLWVRHGSDAFVVRSGLRSLGDETDASRIASEAIEVLLASAVLAQL